jgi:hypothetical protein
MTAYRTASKTSYDVRFFRMHTGMFAGHKRRKRLACRSAVPIAADRLLPPSGLGRDSSGGNDALDGYDARFISDTLPSNLKTPPASERQNKLLWHDV